MTEENLTYTDSEFVTVIQQIMHIDFKDGQYLDVDGSPLGGELKDSIKNAINRDNDHVRIRAKINMSKIPEGRKLHLILLLNLTERLIHMETHQAYYKPHEYVEVADAITSHLQTLYGE